MKSSKSSAKNSISFEENVSQWIKYYEFVKKNVSTCVTTNRLVCAQLASKISVFLWIYKKKHVHLTIISVD